jgi:hypothetical protein
MRNSIATMSILVLLMCGCNAIEEWENNPALVRSKAELAGGAAVYTYFSIKPDAKAGVEHLREVIKAIDGVVLSFPDEGFMVFLPDVNKKLEEVMKGDAAIYLPPAKLLASVLLESLQQKAEKDHWFDDKEAVSDILSAFLGGADDALAAYVVKPDP